MQKCIFVGAPIQAGASQAGCIMGPDALRTAGLADAIENLGYQVEDWGNLEPEIKHIAPHPNKSVHGLEEVAAWIQKLSEEGYKAASDALPIFLGGDHALSAGSVAGIAKAAKEKDKKLFVLWLDAHPDFHTLDTTQSGNLHGTPVAYFTGQKGFENYYPPLEVGVEPDKICMMGLRSVDEEESSALLKLGVTLHDMRTIDEHGIVRLLREFLKQVSAQDGWLHVSLDVDFLDPQIAPAVGTTVDGGATFREAHLIMEMLHESGFVSSLDLVELNPFLDTRGRTAKLLVDLTASLFGRRIIDRMTKSY